MALSKGFETKYKQPATYWKISHFEKLDFITDQAIVILEGYEGEQDRLNNEMYLDSKRFSITGIKQNDKNIRQYAYEELKKLPEWEGSENI